MKSDLLGSHTIYKTCHSLNLHKSYKGNVDVLSFKCAGIAEVLDPKGLRAGMNKTGHMKGLTHSGRE
jgi:hypothetical protein